MFNEDNEEIKDITKSIIEDMRYHLKWTIAALAGLCILHVACTIFLIVKCAP